MFSPPTVSPIPMRLFRLLALLTLGLPSLGHAQAIRGRVVDAAQGLPIAGALVELQDSAGRVLRRTIASPTGAYQLVVPRPAAYRVRVAAIGFTIHPVVVARIGAASIALPDFRLEPAVTILPDVVAAGKRRACGPDIMADPLLGRLLEAGKNALTQIEATLEVGTEFPFQEVATRTVVTATVDSVRADTTTGILTGWPLQSIDPETLRRVGFSRVLAPEEGIGRVYYGPDLRVLFADWFLDGHCFSFSQDVRDAAAGVIRVRYEPRARTGLVDISGELVLDVSSLALRELIFAHEHLPTFMPKGSAGGRIAFALQEGDGWLPVRWEIYAPMEMATLGMSTQRDLVVASRAPAMTIHGEVRGRVVLVGAIVRPPPP
ncbi:MAG: carboxypeptidase regulatory-like domain-containing protein [Gemmatimonadales bacterium]|nr:carboxypeptidase regulatory-like domain-containing protein [Gemmatimonadales bacterium]